MYHSTYSPKVLREENVANQELAMMSYAVPPSASHRPLLATSLDTRGVFEFVRTLPRLLRIKRDSLVTELILSTALMYLSESSFSVLPASRRLRIIRESRVTEILHQSVSLIDCKLALKDARMGEYRVVPGALLEKGIFLRL